MKILLPLLLIAFTFQTQAQTVGMFYNNPGTEPGYVLFAPSPSDSTFLIDKCGKRIHEWGSAYNPGLTVYILPDGTLLRAGSTGNNAFFGGGAGGIILKEDWNGNLLWSYKISDNSQCQHHDAMPMPNGNVMAIAWESHTKQDAQDNGRVSVGNTMWSEKIMEIQPVGTDSGIIVWQWRAWDHLIQDADSTKLNYGVVKDHPELLDINLGTLNGFSSDWLHMNGLDYDPVTDQLLVSCHNLSEVYIIDHSTTTAEAASHTGGISGHGGDLLYRWGNPENYRRGTDDDRRLFQQHNATFIKPGFPGAGHILVFNNGVGRPGTDYSTADEFIPPTMVNNNYPIDPDSAYAPDSAVWSYSTNPPNILFSSVEGGAQRLANGNTLICEGTSGHFWEVDSNKNLVWEYVNPVDINGNTPQGGQPFQNTCFRATHIYFNDPGLAGQTLTPGAPIEINPFVYTCDNIPTAVTTIKFPEGQLAVYPNPFSQSFTIILPAAVNNALLQVHDLAGKLLYEDAHFNAAQGESNLITLNNYKGVAFVSIHDAHGLHEWNVAVVAE